MTEQELAGIYKKAFHKNIKVKDITGKVFEGVCSGFTWAVDNDPEIASIMLDPVKDKKSMYYDIFATEIESIEVME